MTNPTPPFDELLLFTIDWRNRPVTQRLINSLASLPITLWIIINDDLAATYSLPAGAQLSLKKHRIGRNVGFAAACNQACMLASQQGANYLLHMNNDLQLSLAEQLLPFITLFKAQPHCAIASPTIQLSNERVEFAGSHPLARLSSALIIANKQPPTDQQRLHPTQFINGACFIARCEALQQVGGFDEAYFAYREEHDLSFRLKQANWQIGHIPAMQVTHSLSASSNRTPYFKNLLITRGQLLFLQKNLRGIEALLFALIFALKTLLKVISALLSGNIQTIKAVRDAFKNRLFKQPLQLKILDEEIKLP